METRAYSIIGKKGIDDLRSLYAFHGNSQGDDSVSNSIEDYISAKGWMSFGFDCEMTNEAIAKEIERRVLWNQNYIRELEEQGKFGEEYTVSIELVHNPLYDDKQIFAGDNYPLASYRMVFLDGSDTDKT